MSLQKEIKFCRYIPVEYWKLLTQCFSLSINIQQNSKYKIIQNILLILITNLFYIIHYYFMKFAIIILLFFVTSSIYLGTMRILLFHISDTLHDNRLFLVSLRWGQPPTNPTLAVNQPGRDLVAICDVVSVWVQQVWWTAAPPQAPATAPALSVGSADTCPSLWPHAVPPLSEPRGASRGKYNQGFYRGCRLTGRGDARKGRGRVCWWRKELERLSPVEVVYRSEDEVC